jgi:hypothetical protein
MRHSGRSCVPILKSFGPGCQPPNPPKRLVTGTASRWGREMNKHKFKIGQPVGYRAPRGLDVPSGTYIVTARLPALSGEPRYRIRHSTEVDDRVAAESELHQRGLK